MNTFNLEVYDLCGSQSWALSHPTKTEEDFKADVNFLLKKYGRDYIETSFCEFKDDKKRPIHITIEYWIAYIFNKMSELGYSEHKDTGNYYLGGLGIITTNTEYHETEDYFTFENIVGQKLMKKAIKHNESIYGKEE